MVREHGQGQNQESRKGVELQPDGAFFTASEVFMHLGMTRPGDRTRGDEMRIAGVLTDLGFVHERRQISGNRRWGWIKP